MSSYHTFKEHQLSAAERLWLEEAAHSDFSPRRALDRLRGKIPDDFRPNLIDSRLYDGSRIKPIGLWHVDPAHPALQLLDRVIRAIRDHIPVEDVEVMFTAAQVAQLAGAEEPAAARAFQQLMDFGAGFFNIGRELPNGALDSTPLNSVRAISSTTTGSTTESRTCWSARTRGPAKIFMQPRATPSAKHPPCSRLTSACASCSCFSSMS